MGVMKWIPTELDPHRMIAEPTLRAVREVLRDATDGVTTPVSVSLGDYPVLDEVGGVARVASVGVARVGRRSYVAFEMSDDGLREVPVAVDAATGTLRITPR